MRNFIVLASFFVTFSAYALTCKGKIISIGDWESTVIAACGTPTNSYQYTEKVVNNYREDTALKVITENQMTRNVYNLGAQKFMTALIFQNGKLIKIETGGYGYPQ